VHDRAPGKVENSPKPHLAHWNWLLLLLYVPLRQSEKDTLAATLNEPGGESVQLPFEAYLPATQSVHDAEPRPGATKPDGQSRQAVAPGTEL
jgi:hypothetical protein